MDGPDLTIHDIPSSVLQSVFSFLEPRELCTAAAVSRTWRTLISHDVHIWQNLFRKKWLVTPYQNEFTHWKTLYGKKMQNAFSMSGRHRADYLSGHRSAIRTVKLYPTHNIVVTGAYLFPTVKT